MGRLILLRHGHPDGHDGRCVGHYDTPLSETGAGEVRAIAERLTRTRHMAPRRIVSSDLRRARDTARALAGVWQAPVETDARLREMSFGEWEGRSWGDIRATDARRLDAWGAGWIRGAPPGGESGEQFASRVSSALAALRLEAHETSADLLVVTHAGVIRVATTLLLGEPLHVAFDRAIDFARAGVFTIETPTSARLLAWNVDYAEISID